MLAYINSNKDWLRVSLTNLVLFFISSNYLGPKGSKGISYINSSGWDQGLKVNRTCWVSEGKEDSVWLISVSI